MLLDGLLVNGELASQEVNNLVSLVTLELDNLSVLLVLADVSVAGKILLENLQDSLEVIFFGKALDCSQSLSSVSLLDTDMDVVGRLSIVVTSVGEGICVSASAGRGLGARWRCTKPELSKCTNSAV